MRKGLAIILLVMGLLSWNCYRFGKHDADKYWKQRISDLSGVPDPDGLPNDCKDSKFKIFWYNPHTGAHYDTCEEAIPYR